MLVCVLVLSRLSAGQTGVSASHAQQAAPPPSSSLDCSAILEAVPQRQRDVRRIPEKRVNPASAALLGMVRTDEDLPLPGVRVELTPMTGRTSISGETRSDGIVRIPAIAPGKYCITFSNPPDFSRLSENAIEFNAGEALVVDVRMRRISAAASDARRIPENPETLTPETEAGTYRELFRRPAEEMRAELQMVPERSYMAPDPDRWDVSMPSWNRYGQRRGEFPYVSGHWWDPFNQNRLKGDKPIFGQTTFLNLSATSATSLDGRRLFVPSGVSAENPGSSGFFGSGFQTSLEETVRLSFDLFHGDTSFKPVDWRIKITPAFNVNQLWARERGTVNIDVREGTSRTDGHIGIQEAFVEKKIADLGPNYDFISVRAGMQQFSSDFRGLLFTQEQPGVRVFGNLHANRLQYNAAYFFFLEKDTNSGLNTLNSRHQQVALANLYWQDFFFRGYTTQFSYHYNKDDASSHFDENGFLVRPAPIGAVTPHNIRAHYIGWTSNGHIGKLDISHAFYEALGHDDFNPVAGRRTGINAQMAALELSVDRDWVRLHTSAFFASGDSQPRNGTATGFDAISEAQEFSGGIFSFFNREGIRLTGTGVALVAPDSFLPNLRSSKDEGQANFVNPGIFLVNAGADFNITPALRAVANLNYMRFNRTEPLELLLFQSNLDRSIGFDYSVGVVYRPKFSENMTVIGGVAALTPGTGLRRIYTSQTLVSTFTTVRLKF